MVGRVSIGKPRTETSEPGIVESAVRLTMLEIQELALNLFRNSYQTVADEVLKIAAERGITRVVELGAGTAPLTDLLVTMPAANNLELIACDLEPNVEVYAELERKHSGRVEAIKTPVDFCEYRDWGPGTLLVLVAAFPAIPPEIRHQALESFTLSSDCVMMYEPSRKSFLADISSLLSFIPGLLLPLAYLGKPGRLRRLFCCWLPPISPLLYVMDGLWWNRRCWTDQEWEGHLSETLAEANSGREPLIRSSTNSQLVIW